MDTVSVKTGQAKGCTDSRVTMWHVGKHDVQLGQLHTLGQNTVYPFEWFWRNAQFISQNR